jgi:spore coat polysaccharide biosynthesis protein SpsF (cytidylyltransferase family)
MLVIIQARFSSQRLAGKVLRPMAGTPMLAWVCERARAARRVTRMMVATSQDASDDPVAAFCQDRGIDCFRGSLHDVAERLTAAARSAGADAFVRVSGDSPLMLPAIVDDVIALFECARPDLATNVQLRTFPKGMSVEAIALDGLDRAREKMLPGEEEHVTPPFYRQPEQFRVVNLTSGHDFGAVQLSVDAAADFALAEAMLRAGGTTLSLEGLVALRERCRAEVPA